MYSKGRIQVSMVKTLARENHNNSLHVTQDSEGKYKLECNLSSCYGIVELFDR